MNILVLDVGTSSMRGILYTQEGKKLAEKQVLYHMTYMPNGFAEQDPSDWENALYRIVKEISSEAIENNWPLQAISMTSQRSSVIPVDASIRPLCHAIMWQDKRTTAICEALQPHNERIFSLCGSRVNPVYSGSKMAWVREQAPDLYRRTEKFLVIPDYLIYLMTGRLVTDYTYGSRSNLMNIRSHEWDDELLDYFHVEKSKLCELIEPGTVCGKTSFAFSDRTGCPEGIPVLSSGGDQQCGAIGQGVIREGILSVTAGTGGFLITTTDHIPDNLVQDVILNDSSVKGQYILESSILTCCSAFDWFRKEFYGDLSFDEIERLITEEPVGSNGCLCIPYFQGRSTPDWNNLARGMFANVTLATTRQDMLRSLLEAICYEIGNGIDTMTNYVKILDIYVNGGLTNSFAFNEIQSNVYGRKITHCGNSDATARGALILAATALGAYKSVAEAYETIERKEEVQIVTPDQEAAKKYRQLRAQMNDLYQKIYA